MGRDDFKEYAIKDDEVFYKDKGHSREFKLYGHGEELRSQFVRDSQRILHSNAFRRLKHKTQVFFNIDSDHVCTRMEHVLHVQSVSGTIASNLGLNTNLTNAIAMGHDLGHAPFGHEGENVLSNLSHKYIGEGFWHERNSLRFVDKIELLKDDEGRYQRLDLTYYVRDGIISHCGELDQNVLIPRLEPINLEKEFLEKGKYQPYTWEGCVVKISDKIAYVGRDIEDAISLGFLNKAQEAELDKIRANLSTTTIMHDLIKDICDNSTPEAGIRLSEEKADMLQKIKDFNGRNIYANEKLKPYKDYCENVLNELFAVLGRCYDGKNTMEKLLDSPFPYFTHEFVDYLCKYCGEDDIPEEILKGGEYSKKIYINDVIYEDLSDEHTYYQAVIDFLSGMTDRYAVKIYDSLLRFNSRDFVIFSKETYKSSDRRQSGDKSDFSERTQDR